MCRIKVRFCIARSAQIKKMERHFRLKIQFYIEIWHAKIKFNNFSFFTLPTTHPRPSAPSSAVPGAPSESDARTPWRSWSRLHRYALGSAQRSRSDNLGRSLPPGHHTHREGCHSPLPPSTPASSGPAPPRFSAPRARPGKRYHGNTAAG